MVTTGERGCIVDRVHVLDTLRRVPSSRKSDSNFRMLVT